MTLIAIVVHTVKKRTDRKKSEGKKTFTLSEGIRRMSVATIMNGVAIMEQEGTDIKTPTNQ